MNEEEKQTIQIEILNTLVDIKKLQLTRKSLLKEASVLGIIALAIMGAGAYGSMERWTDFPIFQASIAAGGILLAIAFRPLQQCKGEIDLYEKKLSELESLLKKNNLEYKADVRVSRDSKGEYVVQKSIKLGTIK
jgi:hypothetical protein